MELVPLKVKIGLKASGQALYPNFNELQVVKDTGMDWSKYVDVHGDGWHYDKVSGHADDTVDSPKGQQFGVLLVPEAFVDQAVAAFPTECEEINETDYEIFHNTKERANTPTEVMDKDVVDRIVAKQALGIALSAEDNKALDPNDPTPGIRKNDEKTWVDYKAKKGITIKPRVIAAK